MGWRGWVWKRGWKGKGKEGEVERTVSGSGLGGWGKDVWLVEIECV